MTEPTTPTSDAPGGGGDTPIQPDGGGGQTPKSFTQEQLDAILADRLSRERQKYADYDTLKTAADELKKLQDAQKSEAEKLQDSLKAAQAERDEAVQRANDTLIKAAFISAGAAANLVNPADAYALADLSGVSIKEDGTVDGVEAAVKAIVDGGRLPVKGKTPAPSLNGGAGSTQRPGSGEPPLTAEELATAKKMGVKPEDYAKYKAKT